jgi:hypothetical protein
VVSSNIPLHEVEAARFRKFFEKYTNHPIPTKSTLRKNYLASCYEDTINKISNSVGKNKIWVSTDETSDVDGIFVANVVVGTFKHEQPAEIFLLVFEVLERVNYSSLLLFSTMQ